MVFFNAIKMVVLVSLAVVIKVSNTEFSRYDILQGLRIAETGLNVGKLQSWYYCCMKCEPIMNCTAVNYNQESLVCEVIYKSQNQSTFVPTATTNSNVYSKHLNDINPLFNASATQSSTLFSAIAERAIDGNKNGNFGRKSCTHTFGAVGEWWMVDFKRVFGITGVIIWNRQDCCYELQRELVLSVATSLDTIDSTDNVCANYTGPPPSPSENRIEIPCLRQMTDINGNDVNLCLCDFGESHIILIRVMPL